MKLDPSLLKEFDIIDYGYTEVLEPLSFERYQDWVRQEEHGPLSYLADERKEKRRSLKEVYPTAQAAMAFLFDYRGTRKTLNEKEKALKKTMASYALSFEGVDYHHVLPGRLREIALALNISAKPIVDIEPVLERDLAYRCGLGWFGKNSMLINQRYGSYFLIGSLILSEKISTKERKLDTDHCGSCTRCIEACPTDAINPETRTLTAHKCISTYTIELFKASKAPAGMNAETKEVFGCDICQQVCPWNDKPLSLVEAAKLGDKAMEVLDLLGREKLDEIASHSKRAFKKKYDYSPIGRTGRDGILKNFLK